MNHNAPTSAAPMPTDDDSPRFGGEGVFTRMSPNAKAKIIFLVLLLLVLVGGAFAVKHRWSQTASIITGSPLPQREETPSERKSRNFELESTTAAPLPPIVLPPPTDPTHMAFDPSTMPLHRPFATAVAPGMPSKAMMVDDGHRPGTTIATSSPIVVAPSASATLIRTAHTASNVSASHTPASGAHPQAHTIEAQAVLARERQGPLVTSTAQISATKLGRRSYVLAKGAFIPCVLETQLVSNVFGMTSCVVTQHVYSDNGHMLLIERGSKVTGNYGSNLRNGDSRLAVIWDRIKTPNGITVDVNSPGSDGVGAMGLPGDVDMHWAKRIGGALMLSLLQDSVQYATSSLAYNSYLKEQREIAATQPPVQTAATKTTQTTTTQTDPATGHAVTTVTTTSDGPAPASGRTSNSTAPPIPVFGGNNTVKQSTSISEQVLAASINAAPTLYKNRGDIVFIFLTNDLWFDRVYGLKE